MKAIAILVVLLSSMGWSQSLLLSSYYGNQGWNMQQVRDMENWQGKKQDAVVLFSSFCDTQIANLFTSQLPAIWNNKNIPLLTWEMYSCNSSATPANIAAQIASGQYDSYLNAYADKMKAWLSGLDGVLGSSDDRRIFIRLAHEMNGSWYPWSGNPTAYVAMWKHIHQAFDARGLGASYIQWAFVANSGDVGAFTLEQYYPGDAFVDWVGIDGYNSYSQNTSNSPAVTFTPVMARLRALAPAKPVMIAEWGALTYSGGLTVATKNAWIAQFFAYVASQPTIRLVSVYNRDSSTSHDWAVFGGGSGDGLFGNYKTYSAYKAAVQQSNVVGPDVANPRLLTDSQFQGAVSAKVALPVSCAPGSATDFADIAVVGKQRYVCSWTVTQ